MRKENASLYWTVALYLVLSTICVTAKKLYPMKAAVAAEDDMAAENTDHYPEFVRKENDGVCETAFHRCNADNSKYSLLPSSPALSRNNAVAIITAKVDYRFNFDIVPTATIGDLASILHFNAGNKDCCDLGNRSPAIWFYPSSTKLLVKIGDSTNGDWGFDTDALPLNVRSEDFAKRIVDHLKGKQDPDASFRHFVKKGGFALLDMPSAGVRDVLVVSLKEEKQRTAKEVTNALEKWVFPIFGLPTILHSDNVNHLIEDVLATWPGAVQLVSGRPRHPQSQGLVEQAHNTLERIMSSRIAESVVVPDARLKGLINEEDLELTGEMESAQDTSDVDRTTVELTLQHNSATTIQHSSLDSIHDSSPTDVTSNDSNTNSKLGDGVSRCCNSESETEEKDKTLPHFEL
eukprot:Em0001g3055a